MQRTKGIGIRAVCHGKHVILSRNAHAVAPCKRFGGRFVHNEQLTALFAEAVERTALDKTFKHMLVDISLGHAREEIL